MTSRRRTARRGALLAGLIAVGAIGAACTPSGSNVEIRTIIRTFRDAGFEPDPSMISCADRADHRAGSGYTRYYQRCTYGSSYVFDVNTDYRTDNTFHSVAVRVKAPPYTVPPAYACGGRKSGSSWVFDWCGPNV